jgi:predicted O-linked N-acetylglucosamine transferase (SPINDLY family)
MPDVSDRIVFVPPMKPDRCLNLVALADVMLDPVHFGGVNTPRKIFLKAP